MDLLAARSYERIDKRDLRRLGELAALDREKFFLGRTEYRPRLLCVALCQGAGKHYVDVKRRAAEPNGVKDFDVWSFFADIPGQRFPANRRNLHADFGPSKFGREADPPARWAHFAGRRVDFLMRGLAVPVDADPVVEVQEYLRRAKTKTARLLSTKGVVLIEPAALLATIAWPAKK